MKHAHAWLIATCVAIPVFLAAENTPPKSPPVQPVAKPPEQDSLKPVDVKAFDAPRYHCDDCGTKGFPGPRCDQKLLASAKSIGYPTPQGGPECTHWVWKLLSTKADWNGDRYVNAKDWEGMSLAAKKTKLQDIGAYVDEIDDAYGKIFKQTNLIIDLYQKGTKRFGATPGRPDIATWAPRQTQCKAFADSGLWIPAETKPGDRFATYQDRLSYLQTKLSPLELKGGASAEDLKKDFEATAKALGLRDVVLGKQLRDLGGAVDSMRGAVQKLCAAPASEGAKVADEKLNVKDIESMRKAVDQAGKEAMEAALLGGEAGAKLSPEAKAGVKASMQELVVIYDPKDHQPMFVQHIVAKGKDGKEVESYKTFHVGEGGADTITKLVQQLAGQVRHDDSLWTAMKAAVGVVVADPVAAVKNTAKNLKDWFPPTSGKSKEALEERYGAAESQTGVDVQNKLGKTDADIVKWHRKAWDACAQQWAKDDAQVQMIDRTLKGARHDAAMAELAKARPGYAAPGVDGRGSVPCKDPQNSGLDETANARWNGVVDQTDAELAAAKNQRADLMERLEDSEVVKTRLRREYLRQMLVANGDYFKEYVAGGRKSVRDEMKKTMAWTRNEAIQNAGIDAYFDAHWGDGTFYLKGWQSLPKLKPDTFGQYLAAEAKPVGPSYKAPCKLEVSFIRQMAGLFPAWGREWWRVLGGQAPDAEVLKYVTPFVLKDFEDQQGKAPSTKPAPEREWHPQLMVGAPGARAS